MAERLPHHEVSGGNVFADIGMPDADAHLLKAQLVSRVDDILKARKMSQTEAARLLGVAQPDLSKILRGRFRGYSVERLMRFLATLGCDVEIVIRERGGASEPQTIRLFPLPPAMAAE